MAGNIEFGQKYNWLRGGSLSQSEKEKFLFELLIKGGLGETLILVLGLSICINPAKYLNFVSC